MAIGPWHARVHKHACQQEFGARAVEGTGLTFGDNIEHLWAWLRKHAHLMKYMAPANRQDYLVVLVRLLLLPADVVLLNVKHAARNQFQHGSNDCSK